MLVPLRRTSFSPPSMVYISVIILHTLQITIFHMLDLCGQLSCTASIPVFLTCGYSSCLYFYHEALRSLQHVHQPSTRAPT